MTGMVTGEIKKQSLTALLHEYPERDVELCDVIFVHNDA